MTEKKQDIAADMSEGIITNAELEKWNERIGLSLRIGNIFNQNASYEAIRNYANGIGDWNPLYRDEAYAKKTRYGALIAPPNWLYSTFPTWVLQGLPGIHAFHSGNDWEFYRPIYINDRITPECIFTGYDVKLSAFSGKMVMEYQRALFRNQRDELVAQTDLWIVRAERSSARKTGKYAKIEMPHPWTPAELEKVDADVLAEEVRGANVRYWEDVEVGEELVPVVKGPLGLTDIVAYCVGAAPVQIAAHGVQLRLYQKHPAWAFRDPENQSWEPVYGVHYLKPAARAAGVPYPYDVGAQRHSWQINFLCNWIGDEGWIKKNYAEYRRFVYLSDVVWFRGKVTKKYVDGDRESVVEVETSGFNQRGENTIPGSAVIALPSRERGTWPLEKRLPPPEYRGTGR
ncbi:MAG: MaoC family dehydratase N-terminal domain-containing protein [Candidatus Tectomicrobia bacterium]|uniref:MaoC family dehydratase N-terminal domain-containing protein n=1 Tax=Tectimicrobiota bacterium TaxID=2528274 RepID=A0A932FZ83_UNCTE|nr:MaoC family dehydratase N-terminal domain-containing protein [Candidatus Tectomicrobia bacterium]